MEERKKAGLGILVSLAFLMLCAIPYIDANSKKPEEIKTVALTYDDGPNPVYTEKLLKVLAEEDVPATFFLMGKQVELYPEIVKEIRNEGHMIGNHTYSHINVCNTSREQVFEEIKKTNELIFQSCGSYPELFRPPFGCERKGLSEELAMFFVFWNIDTRDWHVQNTSAIVNRILKNVKDGDIILMHDAYDTTVEATKTVIPKLKEMGYTFVTADEILQP